MDSVDLAVLAAAEQWVQGGEPVLLATVVNTWGSAPRPVGSMMALRPSDGHVVGSVSGGCVEDDLIAQARSGALALNAPIVLTYGVSADDARRFRLPCGGTLEVVLEPVSAHSKLRLLAEALAQRHAVTRSLDMQTGAVQLRLGGGAPRVQFDGQTLVTVHGPRCRLLIIGAAQISGYLAGMAQALDYDVTVCDPREEYLAEWTLPGVRLSAMMPDDLIVEMQLDHSSAVVALTHDPKLDDMALLEALKSNAFYVGAIGSRRNNARRRERLALFDLSPEHIARLHGPVGLHIGARTPPEIAVAVLAEMTAVRNGVPVRQTHEARPPAPEFAAMDAALHDPDVRERAVGDPGCVRDADVPADLAQRP